MAFPIVDNDSCIACGACSEACPSGCYDIAEMAVMARPDDCTGCGICVDECPNEVISL